MPEDGGKNRLTSVEVYFCMKHNTAGFRTARPIEYRYKEGVYVPPGELLAESGRARPAQEMGQGGGGSRGSECPVKEIHRTVSPRAELRDL